MIAVPSTGHARPRWWTKGALGLLFSLRDACTLRVTVRDEMFSYAFVCSNLHTYRRAATLFVKEAGTIAWLKSTLRASDVFLDIGANVGLYTIYGARRLATGRVYAVEPHVANATALLANLTANGLLDRVTVLTCALAGKPGFGRFAYESLSDGAALNQFGATLATNAVAGETKFAATVDQLVRDGAIQAPQVVKIDVDGIELDILQGMRDTLTSADRPRSVQVEVDARNTAAIEALMHELGYNAGARHYTLAGEKRLKRGEVPSSIAHNIVFAVA